MTHAYRQFWMGHKGDVEAVYTTSKGRLPEEVIEDMRKCYKECEPFLSIAQPSEQSSIIKEAKIEALKSIAKTLLGIDLLEVKIAKEKEVGRRLNVNETIELFESELKKLREGKHNPQRIISERELEGYLTEGMAVYFHTAFTKDIDKERLICSEHNLLMEALRWNTS